MRAAALLFVLCAGCSPVVSLGGDGQSLTVAQPTCRGALPYSRTTTGTGAHCLRWNTPSLTYAVDRASATGRPTSEESAAIDRAFSTWQAAAEPCSDRAFAPGALGEVQVAMRERLCDAVVGSHDPCWADLSCAGRFRCWDQTPAGVAITSVTYTASDGLIHGAVVELNAASFVFSTVDQPACPLDQPQSTCVAYDVRGTVIHELGHVLGLSHTDAAGSTMRAGADVGDLSLRQIDSGSACFLCEVYPRGGPARDCR